MVPVNLLVQTTIWRQGLKRTSASTSEQTRHSSIYKMQVRSRKCIISQLLVKCYYDEVMHPERDWTTCLCSFSDVSFADLADSSSTGTLPAEGHMTTRQKQTVTLLTRTLHTSIHVGNLLTKYIKSKIHVLNTQQMVLKWSLYWHNVHATIDCKSVKLILKLEKNTG